MLEKVIDTANTFLIKGVDLVFKPVHAQGWTPDKGTGEDINTLIKNGLNVALIMAGVVAVAFLIWNGIKYIMAGGDAGKAKEAQQGMTNAIIGLVVALAAFVIVQFIFNVLGLDQGPTSDVTEFG